MTDIGEVKAAIALASSTNGDPNSIQALKHLESLEKVSIRCKGKGIYLCTKIAFFHVLWSTRQL